jgi:hypothetical protein
LSLLGSRKCFLLQLGVNWVSKELLSTVILSVPCLVRVNSKLQGPAEPNQREDNEKDEGQENAEGNDEDYQYEEKKVQKKNAIDGMSVVVVVS